MNGDADSIGDHLVEIPASHFLAQDGDYIATGELIPVKNTDHDFIQFKAIKQDWIAGEGYDQSFVPDKEYGSRGLAATVLSEKSGIRLHVYTDEPTVHFYTGKYLNVKNGKQGKNDKPFTGFCLETRHHANAVNIPSFPGTLLHPGEVYRHKTTYCLGVD